MGFCPQQSDPSVHSEDPSPEQRCHRSRVRDEVATEVMTRCRSGMRWPRRPPIGDESVSSAQRERDVVLHELADQRQQVAAIAQPHRTWRAGTGTAGASGGDGRPVQRRRRRPRCSSSPACCQRQPQNQPGTWTSSDEPYPPSRTHHRGRRSSTPPAMVAVRTSTAGPVRTPPIRPRRRRGTRRTRRRARPSRPGTRERTGRADTTSTSCALKSNDGHTKQSGTRSPTEHQRGRSRCRRHPGRTRCTPRLRCAA